MVGRRAQFAVARRNVFTHKGLASRGRWRRTGNSSADASAIGVCPTAGRAPKPIKVVGRFTVGCAAKRPPPLLHDRVPLFVEANVGVKTETDAAACQEPLLLFVLFSQSEQTVSELVGQNVGKPGPFIEIDLRSCGVTPALPGDRDQLRRLVSDAR